MSAIIVGHQFGSSIALPLVKPTGLPPEILQNRGRWLRLRLWAAQRFFFRQFRWVECCARRSTPVQHSRTIHSTGFDLKRSYGRSSATVERSNARNLFRRLLPAEDIIRYDFYACSVFRPCRFCHSTADLVRCAKFQHPTIFYTRCHVVARGFSNISRGTRNFQRTGGFHAIPTAEHRVPSCAAAPIRNQMHRWRR